jgi:hypothetical protein
MYSQALLSALLMAAVAHGAPNQAQPAQAVNNELRSPVAQGNVQQLGSQLAETQTQKVDTEVKEFMENTKNTVILMADELTLGELVKQGKQMAESAKEDMSKRERRQARRERRRERRRGSKEAQEELDMEVQEKQEMLSEYVAEIQSRIQNHDLCMVYDKYESDSFMHDCYRLNDDEEETELDVVARSYLVPLAVISMNKDTRAFGFESAALSGNITEITREATYQQMHSFRIQSMDLPDPAKLFCVYSEEEYEGEEVCYYREGRHVSPFRDPAEGAKNPFPDPIRSFKTVFEGCQVTGKKSPFKGMPHRINSEPAKVFTEAEKADWMTFNLTCKPETPQDI